MLERQDCPFSVELGTILIIPGVSPQPGGSNDPMAGDQQGEWVSSHGLANRPSGSRGADGLSDLSVCSGFSPRDHGAGPTHATGEILTFGQPWFHIDGDAFAPIFNRKNQVLVKMFVYLSRDGGSSSPRQFEFLVLLEHHRPKGGGDGPEADGWRVGAHRSTLKSTTSGKWSLAWRRKECGSHEGSTS